MTAIEVAEEVQAAPKRPGFVHQGAVRVHTQDTGFKGDEEAEQALEQLELGL